jgi:hypothetical protein
MPTSEKVYIGRDNEVIFSLYNDKQLWTSDDIDEITKAEICYKDEYYDSDTYPDYFDFVTYASQGAIGVKLGRIVSTEGTDRYAELIIYTATYTNGVVQGRFCLTADGSVRPG